MKKILLYISAGLLAVSFGLLVTAMIFHAVEGNESVLAVIFAAVCAGSAFLGLVIILIVMGKGDKIENKGR